MNSFVSAVFSQQENWLMKKVKVNVATNLGINYRLCQRILF